MRLVTNRNILGKVYPVNSYSEKRARGANDCQTRFNTPYNILNVTIMSLGIESLSTGIRNLHFDCFTLSH